MPRSGPSLLNSSVSELIRSGKTSMAKERVQVEKLQNQPRPSLCTVYPGQARGIQGGTEGSERKRHKVPDPVYGTAESLP